MLARLLFVGDPSPSNLSQALLWLFFLSADKSSSSHSRPAALTAALFFYFHHQGCALDILLAISHLSVLTSSLQHPAQVGHANMYLHLLLLLFFLATIPPSDANIFARGTESFARIATNAHRHAARRSAGLARDLRLSFQGLLAEQPQGVQAVANSRVYCINSPGLSASNSTSPAIVNGTTVVSGPVFTSASSSVGRKPTSTASSGSASATASSAPSSPWKLKQNYVSLAMPLHPYVLTKLL